MARNSAPVLDYNILVRESNTTVDFSHEIYRSNNGMFCAEYDINDSPARQILENEMTLNLIYSLCGVCLTKIGHYIPEGQAKYSERGDKLQLRLYVEANTKDKVQLAMQKIFDIIINYGAQSKLESMGMSTSDDKRDRVEATIMVGIDSAPRSFDIATRIKGEEDFNMKYIGDESGVDIYLRGKGSGYFHYSAEESDKPLHLYLSGKSKSSIKRAKKLAKDLIKSVQSDYLEWCKERGIKGVYQVKRYVVTFC